MKRIDLFTPKCWIALLMVYLEREQNDRFITHSGDIVWLEKRPARMARQAEPRIVKTK
jgi:hypothetical protein